MGRFFRVCKLNFIQCVLELFHMAAYKIVFVTGDETGFERHYSRVLTDKEQKQLLLN